MALEATSGKVRSTNDPGALEGALMKIRHCDIYHLIITKFKWDVHGISLTTERGRTWIPGFAEPEDVSEEVG